MAINRDFAQKAVDFDVVAETRRFIAALAERHRLRIEWVDDPTYDLYCELPPQPGLALDLWFSLSENSVRFGQADWSANFHDIERVDAWNRARRAFEGLITGQSRVALSYSPGRRRPFYTSVQLLNQREWQDASHSLGLAVPPLFRTVYRYNGLEEAGPKGVARGSFVALVGVAAAAWWLFG